MDYSKPLVLVGLMGAGKTTLGKMLAKHFQCGFIDIDEKIVEVTGKSIPDIFATQGEPRFREIEAETIRNVLTGEFCVVSTGGGAVINDSTREFIKSQAISVWIHSAPEVLLKRVGGSDPNRPLLKDEDPLEKLRQLEKDRTKYYEEAHIHIKSGDEPLDATFKQILNQLDAFKPR